MNIAIINGTIVNEGAVFAGHILVEGQRIAKISTEPLSPQELQTARQIDAQGQYVIPGLIDAHVHFRDPKLTHKGDWGTESQAAAAGGVTSVMDMPNTLPATTSLAIMRDKEAIAASKSVVNYSCFIGAMGDNLEEITQIGVNELCGVKIFMGSSTGNMGVSNANAVESLFANSPHLIMAHCEDDTIIAHNLAQARIRFGEDIPFSQHPVIRSEEACLRSTERAMQLAQRYGSRLHVAHVSTGKEAALFTPGHSHITGEACGHYLWWTDQDYDRKQALVKCNPAIKTSQDREQLRRALASGQLSTLGTDHAPHTLDEKRQAYLQAPSGMPAIQHSLLVGMELVKQGYMPIETLVERASHAPARIFGIAGRGYLRPGYYADIAIVQATQPWEVQAAQLLYKCGWSPLEGQTLHHKVTHTLVNGRLVYENGTLHAQAGQGMRLEFERGGGSRHL